MAIGRPSIYTEDLALEICEKIATSSKGIHKLCKENTSFPNPSTIISWLLDGKHEDFSKQYARAREEQAEFMAEEMLDIADDSSNDIRTIEKNGKLIEVENTEFINRSKLRVDTRKFLASKLKPKKYGDKLDVTTDNQPLIFKVVNNKPE